MTDEQPPREISGLFLASTKNLAGAWAEITLVLADRNDLIAGVRELDADSFGPSALEATASAIAAVEAEDAA